MSENSENKVSTIGQDFTLWSLFKFSLPAILTSLVAQLFRSLDDGLFVSRYVGATALAAINLLNPASAVTMAIVNLFAVGCANLSARTMGNGDKEEAKRIFTRATITSIAAGVLFAAVMNIFCDPILYFLGADADTLKDAETYVRIVFGCFPATMLSNVLSFCYSTAGKPQMGLVNSILNGAVNIILDIIFIPVLKLGVVGSSLSTALGDVACLILALVFYFNKDHELCFVKPNGRILSSTLACWRLGLSQSFNSLCFGATTYVTNAMLLKIAGSNGIAANAVIADLRSIFNASYVGFASCCSPIFAYNVGEKNPKKLKKSLIYYVDIWFISTILMTISGELLRYPLIRLFISDPETSPIYDMSVQGLTIEFLATMFMAADICVMRAFSAIGSPQTTTFISIMRNFVFRIPMYILLPTFFGIDGIWWAFPTAEFVTFCMCVYLIYRNRDNYGWGRSGIAKKIQ